MILNILGCGGSGKTTLKFELLKLNRFVGFVTYTTRPKRQGEIDGVHYHFISESTFRAMTFSLERTANGWLYGVLASDLDRGCENTTIVTTFDESGILALEKMGIEVKVVYLDVPKELRRQRMLSRGDNVSDVDNKLFAEDNCLNEFSFKSPLLKIKEETLDKTVILVLEFCER